MRFDIKTVQSTYEGIKPDAAKAISYFYSSLFAQHPEMKVVLEGVDSAHQKSIVIASFSSLIDGLSQPARLRNYLETLGSRFRAMGVNEDHLKAIGKALIETFRFHLKESWSASIEDQWIMALGFMADVILEVPKSKPTPSLAKSESERSSEVELASHVRKIAQRILLKAIQEELDSELVNAAKKRAVSILTQALNEEADLLQHAFNRENKLKTLSN